MFKKDIQFITNDDYYVDRTLNRPSRNLLYNQDLLKHTVKNLASLSGSFGVLTDIDETDHLEVKLSNFSRITLLDTNFLNPRTLVLFQFPSGIYNNQGVIFSSLPDLQKAENYLFSLAGFTDPDTDKIELKIVDNKIKAKITKGVYIDGVLYLKYAYFVNPGSFGEGAELDWLNDSISGFDNIAVLVSFINEYSDAFISLEGLFHTIDFSLLGFDMFEIPEVDIYSIGFNLLGEKVCYNILIDGDAPIEIASVDLTVINPLTMSITDTRVFAYNHIIQTENLVTVNENIHFNGIVESDLIITGDLTVNGTTTTINTATLDVEDNIIRLNKGFETSLIPPDPLLVSGIEVERGVSTNNYFFLFREQDQTFVIGASPDITTDRTTLQAVATREDVPVVNGIPVWNSTVFRFDTTTKLIYTDADGVYVNNKIEAENSITTNEALNINEGVNLGFSLQYNNTTKTLNFFFVGS